MSGKPGELRRKRKNVLTLSARQKRRRLLVDTIIEGDGDGSVQSINNSGDPSVINNSDHSVSTSSDFHRETSGLSDESKCSSVFDCTSSSAQSGDSCGDHRSDSQVDRSRVPSYDNGREASALSSSDSNIHSPFSRTCLSINPAMINHDPMEPLSHHNSSVGDAHDECFDCQEETYLTVCRTCLSCVCVGCPECYHFKDSCCHCEPCRLGFYSGSDAEDDRDSADSDNACESIRSPEVSDAQSEGEKSEAEQDDADSLRSFMDTLSSWALVFKIPLVALSALLKILLVKIPGLPRDGRTLLHTPTQTEVFDMHPGKYWHSGLIKGLTRILSTSAVSDDVVEVSLGVDGLPISSSPRSSLWPILCSAVNKVFIVGAYHGLEKPPNFNMYLKKFVEEAVELVSAGIVIRGRHLKVCFKKLIADAPAKSFVLNSASHNSYHGCPKCTCMGTYIDRRMAFLDSDAPLRQDSDFLNFSDDLEGYHKAFSCLTEIPGFGCVTNVTLDYMHLCCLGVTKKILLLWTKGPLEIRLGNNCVRSLNKVLLSLHGYLPIEFNTRRPSLLFVSQLKATEFRQLLFYSGAVVFRPEQKLDFPLSQEYYEHFMQLHVAVVILSSKRLCKIEEFVNYAEVLLREFVENFIIVYKPEFVSHNVHALIHLAQDVRNFGCLDNFSAFPFENFMGELKSLLRRPGKVLQQLARRYSEREEVRVEAQDLIVENFKGIMPHYNGILPVQCVNPQFKGVILPECRLDVNEANNCCGLKDSSSVMIVENFATCVRRKCLVAIGRVFDTVNNLYEKPLPSSSLGIFKVKTLGDYQVWPVEDIVTKYVRFPIEDESFAVFPLLHHER